MKVLHVVRHLHKLSGVSVFCAEACDALSEEGVEVTVAVQDTSDPNQIPSQAGVKRFEERGLLARSTAKDWDVVHIHNLWTPVLHRGAAWARRNRIPVVWSPHGTLSPWCFNFKRWKKFLPWHLYQKSDLRAASVIHVTSAEEETWVRDAGFDPRIVNIPLGVHLPPQIPDRHNKIKTLLFVGRIAPVKALPNLLRAWAMVKPPDWRLRIVGIQDFPGYTDSLKAQAGSLGVTNAVDFPGQRFNEDLLEEYAHADALVLPSHNENFGAVVIDALAWGIPVITSTGTPWSEVEKVGCGWWVDNSPSKLAAALKILTALPDDERKAMGERGRRFVAERYTWQIVARKLKGVYESLVCR